MKVEIDTEVFVPQAMLEDMTCTLMMIEGFKQHEYLEDYQWEDLWYDIQHLAAIKRVYRHYTLHSEWNTLDNFQVELDHDLTETETGLSFDEAYVMAGGDFENV